MGPHSGFMVSPGFRNQGDFLQALGFRDFIKKEKDLRCDYPSYLKEELLAETLLMDMGNKLKVLIQQKELPRQELMGLKRD
jgi:SAM-dependent MidA family methyltransferase